MEGNHNKARCLPLRGSGCQKGGWQAHSPVLGCFGAEAGPRAVARFTELLSRMCPRSTSFLCREELEGQELGGEDSVCECGGEGVDPGFEKEALPWFSRCSLESGGDRCIPGHRPRWEQQTQLGDWVVVGEGEEQILGGFLQEGWAVKQS